MKVQKLQWDSDFFGYEIGKIVLENGKEKSLSSFLKNNDFKLIYIFCDHSLSQKLLEESHMFLADEKITFGKKISSSNEIKLTNFYFDEIKKMDENVLKITIESGEYSRFRTDKNFVNDEYEKLYKLWIEKSLLKEMADKVIGCYFENKLAGIITLKTNNSESDIGLLSVSKNFRRKNIGSSLLDFANNYALENNVTKITVNTQAENLPAMALYQKNNYQIENRMFIYHLWK